jgi:hypothetical protein
MTSSSTSVPTANEIRVARSGLSTHFASCALIPNWIGSIAPAANPNNRYDQIATGPGSMENPGFPA